MPYATQSKGLWKGGKPPDYHTDIDLKGQGRLAQEEKKKKKKHWPRFLVVQLICLRVQHLAFEMSCTS